MRNTQGRFNICPRPIYPPQVPRQDYSRFIPKSLAELVGMKQTVKGVVIIRVVYGRLPEGRGDQWNKRLIPPLDWPSSVSTTRSTLSTVMTGLTTQELTTFIRSSHTDESHGKRKGFPREGIPNASVHHETTSSQNITSPHTRKIMSRHVSIHLPDNSIVLPSDPIRESEFSLPNYQNTQPITGKLLVHPQTDLLHNPTTILTRHNTTTHLPL